MYIGARKLTAYNTFLNIMVYLAVSIFFILEVNIFVLLLSLIVLITYYIFNVYSMERGRYTLVDLINALVANIITVIITFKIFGLKKSLIIFSILYIFQNISKILIYYFFVKKKSVMIVGINEKAKIIKEILLEKQNYFIAAELSPSEYETYEELIKKREIGKIIITESLEDRKFAELILNLKLKGIQVFDFVTFFEKIEEKVPVNSITEEYILFGSGYDILHASLNQRIKRLFDLILACSVGIITCPVMIIAAIVVKLESKGPIFFSQSRIGLGNHPFKIYKFRSMRLHDEEEHSKYAQDGDNRITKFGNFMRKTRIDELPQLWNVIKGDMSFIGPRAEWDKLCYEYMEKIPFYNIRHSVKPGLTGWAQVRYPYGMGVEDALEKLRYDLYYIKHQNLAFDIMILFQTIKIVIFGSGK